MIENDKALKAQRIAEQYNGIDYRSFEYDGLPPAGVPSPLLRIPEQTALTKKIGNTEYTLNAHFREDGRDLLGYLCELLLKDGVEPNLYYDSE